MFTFKEFQKKRSLDQTVAKETAIFLVCSKRYYTDTEHYARLINSRTDRDGLEYRIPQTRCDPRSDFGKSEG